MKRIALFLLTSFACYETGVAQGPGQFFHQQETELKYYEQQIVYLKMYIGYLEKGYQIAQQDLTAISEIKKNEFNLHQAFFNSQSIVNPQISRHSRIADIIDLQISMISKEAVTSSF